MDRARVHAGEVVDRHDLSGDADREIFALQGGHWLPVAVGDDDVEVHDPNLDLLGEGRRRLLCRRRCGREQEKHDGELA